MGDPTNASYWPILGVWVYGRSMTFSSTAVIPPIAIAIAATPKMPVMCHKREWDSSAQRVNSLTKLTKSLHRRSARLAPVHQIASQLGRWPWVKSPSPRCGAVHSRLCFRRAVRSHADDQHARDPLRQERG